MDLGGPNKSGSRNAPFEVLSQTFNRKEAKDNAIVISVRCHSSVTPASAINVIRYHENPNLVRKIANKSDTSVQPTSNPLMSELLLNPTQSVISKKPMYNTRRMAAGLAEPAIPSSLTCC